MKIYIYVFTLINFTIQIYLFFACLNFSPSEDLKSWFDDHLIFDMLIFETFNVQYLKVK